MPEQKSIQKNWAFRPTTIEELDYLCGMELRSQQNMIEALIHRAYQQVTDTPYDPQMAKDDSSEGK
jgi:hypothetical protein